MKRNLYAAALLVLVGCIVAASGWYVSAAAGQIRSRVEEGYQMALAGRYDQARHSFDKTAAESQGQSRLLALLVRRSLLDEINESLALLGRYSVKDNITDLGAETARVTAQLNQLEESFWAVF